MIVAANSTLDKIIDYFHPPTPLSRLEISWLDVPTTCKYRILNIFKLALLPPEKNVYRGKSNLPFEPGWIFEP